MRVRLMNDAEEGFRPLCAPGHLTRRPQQFQGSSSSTVPPAAAAVPGGSVFSTSRQNQEQGAEQQEGGPFSNRAFGSREWMTEPPAPAAAAAGGGGGGTPADDSSMLQGAEDPAEAEGYAVPAPDPPSSSVLHSSGSAVEPSASDASRSATPP